MAAPGPHGTEVEAPQTIPIRKVWLSRWRQQAVATGYAHLGVDVRPGRKEQPGHLEAALVCGDVQGRHALPVLPTTGKDRDGHAVI